MISMIEKKYTNEEMNIELTSFLDNKQNVWFRGKDVAKILGYSDTDQAITKNVSKNHKMIHLVYPKCCPVVWTRQVQKLAWTFRPPRSNKVDGTHSLTRPAFMNLYLVPN